MASFRITLKHDFGDVSVEDSNENQALANLAKLRALGKSVEKELGFDIRLPDNMMEKIVKLEYIDRVMVIMSYIKKPVSKSDCKNYTQTLSIQETWWRGSNFERDMRKRKIKGLIKILKKEIALYDLTNGGKAHVRNLFQN
jgi:hypothetical protein